jgi:hypothetical protein
MRAYAREATFSLLNFSHFFPLKACQWEAMSPCQPDLENMDKNLKYVHIENLSLQAIHVYINEHQSRGQQTPEKFLNIKRVLHQPT